MYNRYRTLTYLHQRAGVSKSRNIAFLRLSRTFLVPLQLRESYYKPVKMWWWH